MTGLWRRRVTTVAAEREVADVAAPARDHPPAVAPRQNNIFAPPPQQQQQPRVVPRVPPADSRLARLVRIFGEMRRRQVPNFEWGLVFKVVIMMAILFSRLGGGASSSGDDEDQGIPTKFYILGTVLVGGFLFQTGYAQFLYKFIVEENVLYRILILNQDVVIPPPGPARPQRDNNINNNNNDDGWFDWRETFLGGRIQRGEQDPQAPFLWRCVCEIVLLVSSFVLSIFPMWHPQAPPPPPAAPENDDDDDDDQQQGVAANDGAPGVVRPPVDPAEPEEDEEDWDE